MYSTKFKVSKKTKEGTKSSYSACLDLAIEEYSKISLKHGESKTIFKRIWNFPLYRELIEYREHCWNISDTTKKRARPRLSPEEGQYTATEIANFIIEYSIENKCEMSNLKLQNVLYFVQGNFYKVFGIPCFYDELERWSYSFVVPGVYRIYKRYGGIEILRVHSSVEYEKHLDAIVGSTWASLEDRMLPEHKELIIGVVELCKKYGNVSLGMIVRAQPPFNAVNRGDALPKELIKNYFQSKNKSEPEAETEEQYDNSRKN